MKDYNPNQVSQFGLFAALRAAFWIFFSKISLLWQTDLKDLKPWFVLYVKRSSFNIDFIVTNSYKTLGDDKFLFPDEAKEP